MSTRRPSAADPEESVAASWSIDRSISWNPTFTKLIEQIRVGYSGHAWVATDDCGNIATEGSPFV